MPPSTSPSLHLISLSSDGDKCGMIDAESDGCEMNVVDSNDGLMQSWSRAVANKSVTVMGGEINKGN